VRKNLTVPLGLVAALGVNSPLARADTGSDLKLQVSGRESGCPSQTVADPKPVGQEILVAFTAYAVEAPTKQAACNLTLSVDPPQGTRVVIDSFNFKGRLGGGAQAKMTVEYGRGLSLSRLETNLSGSGSTEQIRPTLASDCGRSSTLTINTTLNLSSAGPNAKATVDALTMGFTREPCVE
jgi:hypothetical protein